MGLITDKVKECKECGLETNEIDDICTTCNEAKELAEDVERRIGEVVTLDKTATALLTNHLMANFNIQMAD